MKISLKGILCTFVFLFHFFVVKSQCTVSVGNDTTVCQGSSLVRTATTNTNNPQFQWYLSGNPGNSLSTSSSLNVNTSIAGSYIIVVKVDRNGGGANCPAYDTFRVVVNARPNINAGNNISLCQGAIQNINPTYTPANGSISWFLLGSTTVLGTTATFPVPTTTSGVFNYVVKIDSANTCADFDTVRVTVNPKPTASFDYSPNSGCPRRRRKIYFNSTSSSNGGGNLSYQWNFGDPNSGSNNTSTDNDPEHSFVGSGFNSGGLFTVTLTITTPNGCSATTSQQISIGTFPDATLIDTVNFTPFATCNAGVSLDLTVNNASTTQATNTNYQIVWGDLSPNYSSATMTNVTHTYPQQGYYTLTFIVTSGAGCKDSTDYRVFFGSNPGGSISSPSSTYGCTGQTFSFPFANVASNTPGTEYIIVVNDGTDTVRYTQETLPAVFTHTFDSTSCGTTSNGIPNTFMVTYTISNPCGETPGTIGGIRISKKPKADFSISPQDTVCVNNSVTFTSTGISSAIVPTSGNGPCTDGKLVWDITPNTGWTLTSGILGSTNNQVNQNSWTAGSSAIVINFTTPGVYNIRLRSGGGQCGVGDTTKTICVNPTPIGVFTLDDNIGCSPLFSNATNTSNLPNCGQNKYSWSVTYTPTSGCLPAVSDYNFINGTSANSTNPQFQFNNPGVYTISLIVISPAAACSSAVVTQTVTVKGKPVVNIPPLNAICQNQSITPSSTVSCYIDATSVYAWTFGGGSPATSSASNPGSVAFNTSGTQTIALSVTNECGTTTTNQSLVVNPKPNVNTISNQTLCAGAATSPINFSGSTVPNTIYNWTNNNNSIGLPLSGTGNIASFNPTNNTNAPIVATITVTPVANGCSGTPITFTITVNPNPVVTVNGATICSGSSATLTASGADTYTWTPTTGLSAGTGSTVTANPTSTTSYTVTGTITLTGCKSTATSNVVVNPSPVISGTLTSNPTNCSSATGSITLQGLISGVSYQVQYTGPAGLVNVNITAIAPGNIIIGNLSAGSYSNITVTSNGCNSNAVGPFSLTDPNPPATPTASNNGPLCSGTTLSLTASTTSTGAITWSWTGPNGFSSNLQNPTIANASVLATGTYSVTVTINGCTSSAGTTNVVIRETPATPIASSNSPVCSGNPLTLSASTTSTVPVTWSWSGPNTYTSSSQNPTVSNAATVAMSGTYTVVATATYVTPSITCSSSPTSTVVDVRPTPNISASSSTNPTNCASATGSILLNGLVAGQSYQVQYTGPTGPVTVSLSANPSGNISITGLSAGSYSGISVSLNGCNSNTVGPFTIVDPTPPATPTIASISPICSGSTLQLSASTSSPGVATWSWTGPNGFTSNVSNPSVPNAGIAYDGTYNVTVTINGCTSQAAGVTAIIKETPSTPSASSNSPVCTGNALTLSASTSSTMTVTWSWTGPGSFSSSDQNPTVSNAATLAMAGIYTVIATATYTTPALVCPSSASSTTVVINPTPVISGSSFTNPTNCASATGTITLNGLANNTTYEVHYTNPSGVAVVINVTSNASGVLTINNLPQGNYTNVYVVLNNCPSTPVGPFNLVDPNPPAAPVATTNAPICAGINLTLSVSSPVAGGTYNWSGPGGYTGNGQSVNIPNTTVSMSGTYSVTVTLNSCTSPAGTVSVVINPIPSAPVVSSPVTYCQFSPSSALTAISLNSHTLLWYANSSGGTGVTQAPVPSTADAGNFTVFVSQVSPEGCEGPRAELIIIVNPTPVVTAQSATICSGASFNISPSGSTIPVGTLYSWSAPVVTGGLTGGQAQSDQSSINGTLSNPGDFPQTATYTVTPKTGNCPGNTFQTTITVNPAPRVSFSPAPQTICSGQTTQQVTLTSPTPGVNIPWTAQIPVGISGAQASGNNTIAPATLINNTSGSLTVVYAAVAITNGAAGCPGDTSRYNVVVNPKPNIPAQNITICSREAFSFAPTNNPPTTIVPPGTTYTWTFADNVNVTGETNSAGSSDSIRQQLVNLTNQAQTVVYQVTPTSGGSGSCGGPVFTLTVTVEPRAEIPVLYDTICSGTAFLINPLNGQPGASTIVPPGTTYSWNAPNLIVGIGGLALGSNQTNISGFLTNSTFAPITVTYNVGTQSGNCAGDSFQVKITVNPLASISNNPLSQSVCNQATTTAVNWTSFTAGANYSWTILSSGSVTGFAPAGSGNTLPAMTLGNTGIAQDSVVYLVSSTASACSGPATPYTLYVNPDAFANISYPYDTACWPYSLVINNTSPRSPGNVNIPNGQYDWYSIAPNGNQTFLGSGTNFPGYTIPGSSDSIRIKMVAISAFGCKSDSITHAFYTRPKPVADFDMTNRDSCGPITIAFTNQTNIQDTFDFQWNFGNGQTSTLVNPAPVTYLSSPNFYDTTYYITLTVFNECDTSVYTDSVIVRANPKARFAVSSSSGCSPFVIQITNSSLGNPHTYYWDYGNGVRDTTNTSGLSTYTYYTGVVDTFDLMLIAESNCGRDTQIIKIRVAPNVINPGVSINATELYGCVSHAVNFINTTTGATSFNWNFGDGTPITTTNLFQTLVTHVYNTAGTFTVEIDMTNGCSDTSITKEVTVYPAPQASFTAPTTQCQGDTIRFNNLSTQASNYSWSFGNGVVNTLTNPTYVYPAPGVYTVELVAQQSSPQGLVCADSVSQNITIVAKPDTNLITNIGAANCSPFNMVGNTPSYTNETITWYVYDTTLPVYPVVISNPVLNYTFNNSGVFDVVVVIENAAGCKDSTRRTLIVYAKPVAGFSPLNLVTCNLDTLVSYVNTTTANNFTPLRYRWFVDGIQRATSGNFTYRYTSLPTDILPRIFNTKLVATNSVGCADSIVGTLQMNPTAKSIFTVNNPNDCIPFNVNIVNSSTYTTVHQWYLNGVLVSTDANPVIQITNPNTDYIIEHVASNQYACKSDTSRFSFRSRVMPKAIFRVSDTLGCNGQLNVVTINNSQNATSYDWDWGDGTTNSTLVNPTHLYTAIGTYRITLTAKDAVCRDTTSKIVKVSQRPTASFVADNTRTCDTAFVRMINLTTNATQYYWMLNNGMTSTAISPVFSLPPSATNYSVTLLVINGDGCRDSLTRANYINVIAPPPGDFTVTPSQVQSIPNYTFGFTNLTPDRVMYNYLWSLGDGTFANTRDVISHQYADTGSYIVQLIVVDTITNCTDTVEKVVRIEGYPGYLYVPNAFYPNSNQIQFRSFKPVGKGLQEYELQIFDSWGKLLFRTTKLDAAGSPVESWDGTFKGAPMPQDAYAWRIKAKYRNGRAWEGMKYDKNENGLPAHTFGTLTLFR